MYYLIQHQYLKDGTVAITPVACYETLDEATAQWHSKQAYNMITENVISTLTLIYQTNGFIELNEYWTRETVGEKTE